MQSIVTVQQRRYRSFKRDMIPSSTKTCTEKISATNLEIPDQIDLSRWTKTEWSPYNELEDHATDESPVIDWSRSYSLQFANFDSPPNFYYQQQQRRTTKTRFSLIIERKQLFHTFSPSLPTRSFTHCNLNSTREQRTIRRRFIIIIIINRL